MDFSQFKFRCSSLGYLMSPVKGKTNQEKYDDLRTSYKKKFAQLDSLSDKAIKTKIKLEDELKTLSIQIDALELIKDKVQLSDTAKTHLCDIYTAVKYGRKTEDIKSKYLQKGLHMEEDAITLYSLVTGEFHKKNKQERENEWIKGSMDFPSLNKKVVDTKVNWSIFQFNRVVAKPISHMYKWQGKGYMWLWEADFFDLAYCLLNTPDHLLKAEETKLLYDLIGKREWTCQEEKELCEPAINELRHNHQYEDIPNEEKVRIYELQRNTDDEELIKKYVEAGREYLNNFGNDKDSENTQ